MRGILKRVMESVVPRLGIGRLARLLRQPGPVILAYHNIVPDGASIGGVRSLHLPQQEFARQLDLLVGTREVVPLSAILDAPRSPARPRAAITFDDAYSGAVTAGVAEVVHRGLPATIFAAPEFIGGRSFWWDELADPQVGDIDEEVRRHALSALLGRDPLIREWAESRGLHRHSVPCHSRATTEEDLRHAVSQAGISLGSHSWSHANLSRLAPGDLDRELRDPLEWLRQRFRSVIPWLAYPYGLASSGVERAAAAAGYEVAVLITGAQLPRSRRRLNLHALPRLNIPASLSLRGYALRTAGLGA
ncbi:MAG: polysaccharide deacetylase family protein [Longimicrobiales bacterium]